MQNTVLVVDDMEINREILTEILGEEYRVETAENGRMALEMIEKMQGILAVVLLDLMMPEVDGFAVLEVMQEKGWIEKIPVLIISGETSVKAERKCFDYHISDFIRKPFDNALVKKRVRNVVNLFQYQRNLEDKVQEQTTVLREQNKLLRSQADKLKKSNTNIIEILGTVVEYRDFESGEHINRVKGYTRILARRLAENYPEYGLDQDKIDIIVSASALHDVGKIAIPDNILLKPGRLTDEEFACMKTHTSRGSEILQNIRNAWDDEYGKISYQICRHHHEKFDGRGYPDGLVGDDIPIAAQIVSIADVYDALVNERVYKDAFPKEEAFRMITEGECGKFNPKLLECFRIERQAFEDLKISYDHLENKDNA
ncbi:putative cyclic di-GMP phosphodiesterase [Lachnospiraceae bacterium]|jgi:putative two-component system response regulator|nr:response regulator [Lachnospiraceae bacterium]MCX4273433.1 response regulator [Acetatifactor sp.]GFH96540.1 putative cyclic di-GMP phosphodiesterase [Lachnospiraceae bacterium]